MAELQSTEDLSRGLQQATEEAQRLLDVNEQILKTIEATAKVLKKDISVDFGDASEIAKINKLVEDSNKLAKEREKTDKQRKTTKKKLQDLTDEELKLRIKEQKAFKQRKKDVENELALEKKSIKSRGNLIAVNKALRAEVDRLDVQTQSDQISALNAEIDENTRVINDNVDSDRKRVSTIGRYTEGIKEALGSTSLFGDEAKKLNGVLNALTKIWDKNEDAAKGAADATDDVSDSTSKAGKAAKVATGAFALIGAVLTAIGTAFASTRSGGLELRTTFAEIKATFQVLVASLAGAGAGIFKWVKSLGSAFSILGTNISIWAKETEITLLELANKAPFTDLTDQITTAQNELSKLTDEQTELQKGIDEGNKGMEEASNSFDDFGKRVDETTQAIIDFENQQDALIDSQSRLLISISKLRGEEELNKALEGENAAAIRDRIKAIESAVDANDKRTLKEVKLAKSLLALVNLEIEAARVSSGLGDAYKLSADLTGRYTDAVVNLTDAESERAVSAIDNRALLTQLALDVLEQDLDILVDGFDNQKTINERRLANDRTTLAEKNKILDELLKNQQRFVENSNEAFNQTLQDLGFQQDEIDLIKEKVDLTSLVNTLNTKGEKALNEQIKALGGSEIANKRILEFVREINTFNQDNLDTVQSIREETESIANLEAEIADQKRRLAGEDVEESKEQLIADKIEILEAELALEKEGSLKSLEIEKELNDLKLEQQDERLKKEGDNNKKAAEQQKQLIKEIASFADSIFDKQEEDLDRQREASLDNQDRLQDAIDNGSEKAQESLAAEEARQEKIEARQRKLEDRRIKTEAFIAGLQLLAANGGDLGSTAADITGLSALVNGLQGFYHGTDDTGNGNGMKDQHGNITGFTHDNEQVWSQSDRSDVGFRTRQEIKDLVTIADRGTMAVNPGGLLVTQSNNNAALEHKLDGVIKAIKNQKMESNLYMDGSYITEQVKSDKRKDTLKRKANRFL